MTADLHIHSTASDGRLSPGEIVRQAAAAGLSHIAITDHDTVAAHLELREAASTENSAAKLTIIPGIEFSTDCPRHEIHILGYFIDIDNSRLKDQLGIILADRLQRAKKMVKKLNQLGYLIDYDKVAEFAGQAMAIGRPHVAAALVAGNYFNTATEAFAVLLANNGPAYVPHYKLPPEQVIKLIEQAGGIAVLAHPGLIGNDNLVLNIIKAGVGGLEAFHPEHDQAMTDKYIDIANKYNLKITGGSDFHGIPGRYPAKIGEFTISTVLADTLSR
ncbi:PHP domain-containing protein [Sporomusa termitida]|uniref:Phosphoribosyl 1,2-cyclic phosphate 1,2-diphosphodieSPTERase n=1 Tax=Sporomusa termitida TaxID=2377 RepID=A0A517DTB5_9FIRM|nr:PHP domain-containing protein [Sporomusa termitida]QDR80590.1 Phosphoribosyl 1,2-cyclic phosphate 1,2-diphosphodieSPTERase [Sporomusa termitida]